MTCTYDARGELLLDTPDEWVHVVYCQTERAGVVDYYYFLGPFSLYIWLDISGRLVAVTVCE